MSPLKRDFTTRTNADWNEDFQFRIGAAALDLTGADVRMTMIDDQGRTVLALSIGHGLLLDGASGTLSIRLPASRMQGLPVGMLRHDIQIRLRDTITVPIEGSVVIVKGVSRV